MLAVGVSCGDTLFEGFEASHPLPGNGLPSNHERVARDPASGAVSGSAFPEDPTKVPRGAQGPVSGGCCRAVFLPRLPVLTDRDDRSGQAVDDGGMAKARVASAVRSHGAGLLAFGNLVEQYRQHRAVTGAAGGELHRIDVRCGRVHGRMQLAPPLTVCKQTVAGQRLAAALDAMIACLPFAVTEELVSRAANTQFSGPSARR